MIVPGVIYASINCIAIALHGWAIPAATDIAFAVGILALVGSRIPPALKIFLLALAIIDDLGAIIIIAFFYTQGFIVSALMSATMGIAWVVALNRSGQRKAPPRPMFWTEHPGLALRLEIRSPRHARRRHHRPRRAAQGFRSDRPHDRRHAVRGQAAGGPA